MYPTRNRGDDLLVLLVAAVVVALVYALRQRRPTSTAFGDARWATDALLRRWGLLGGDGGLVIGRTLSGALIRVPRFCHALLVGGTGSGKGVGVILPNLLAQGRAMSILVFDPKGDLFAATANHRHRFGRVIRLAPFDGGTDGLNPLDSIPPGPLLIDRARGLAEALVVREGTAVDPHWDAKAVQVIAALLVLILLRFRPEERNLNSLQGIASDPELLAAAAARLRELGGIPARFGHQIQALFDKAGGPTREGAGVMSTVSRHLACTDSEAVAACLAASTFDAGVLRQPGTTLYVQIPPDLLDAYKGILRVWMTTLIRAIAATDGGSEVLLLMDEASAFGTNFPALEETLVRGRSARLRLVLAFQSEAQVHAAFPTKPTLIHDNCDTKIHLGVNGFEAADRLSKALGTRTEVLESYGSSSSYSHASGNAPGGQSTHGRSTNVAFHGQPLMRPEELLRLGEEYLVATHRGVPDPILGLRIKWYEDPAFAPDPGGPKRKKRWKRPGRRTGQVPRSRLVLALLLAVALGGLTIRAKVYGYGYWAPKVQRR